MEETIYLKDVLQEMRTLSSEGLAVKFDIAVRTFNRFDGNGGKLNRYEDAKQVMVEPGIDPKGIKSLKRKPDASQVVRQRKKPNHWDNKTRNIKLKDGSIRKIHILFIIEFNGKKVIY